MPPKKSKLEIAQRLNPVVHAESAALSAALITAAFSTYHRTRLQKKAAIFNRVDPRLASARPTLSAPVAGAGAALALLQRERSQSHAARGAPALHKKTSAMLTAPALVILDAAASRAANPSTEHKAATWASLRHDLAAQVCRSRSDQSMLNAGQIRAGRSEAIKKQETIRQYAAAAASCTQSHCREDEEDFEEGAEGDGAEAGEESQASDADGDDSVADDEPLQLEMRRDSVDQPASPHTMSLELALEPTVPELLAPSPPELSNHEPAPEAEPAEQAEAARPTSSPNLRQSHPAPEPTFALEISMAASVPA